MSYIHRAVINMLTKPNEMLCLCCDDKLQMNLFGIGSHNLDTYAIISPHKIQKNNMYSSLPGYISIWP